LLKSGYIDARLAAAQSLLSVGQVDAALTAVREAENHPDAHIRARAAVIQEEMKKEIDTERNDQ
jgi:hypothetical protein